MTERIKWLATYQIRPVSAITHVVKVADIRKYKDTGKYAVIFAGAPDKIRAIKLDEGNPGLAR